MAVQIEDSMNYIELLALNNEELILASMDLVDNASKSSLGYCFDNSFRASIMQYLLKLVIQKEIEELPSYSNGNDWKRISLIQRIAKLKETSPTNNHKATKIKHIEENIVSTDEVLISGFIRNEMDIKNNNNFPVDISYVCQTFVGDISNIANQDLRLFSHQDKILIPLSQESSPQLIENKLIGPNQILLAENLSCYDMVPNKSNGIQISDNVQFLKESRSQNIDSNSSFGVVQCLFEKNSQLLNFGGIKKTEIPPPPPYTMHSMPPPMAISLYSMQNTVQACNYLTPNLPLKTIGELIYGRGHMSLCNINDERIAVIGGAKFVKRDHNNNDWGMGMGMAMGGPPPLPGHPGVFYDCVVMDCVEIFDLENKHSLAIKSLNYPRVECGSYYNSYLNEIIVFGGNKGFAPLNDGYGWNAMSMQQPLRRRRIMKNHNIPNSMEIYDFHKNIWIQVPFLSNKKYNKYPCIWTVGGQCIFVSQLMHSKVVPFEIDCEWIDLRTNNQNKSKFNVMMQMSRIPDDIYKSNKKLVKKQRQSFALFLQ